MAIARCAGAPALRARRRAEGMRAAAEDRDIAIGIRNASAAM